MLNHLLLSDELIETPTLKNYDDFVSFFSSSVENYVDNPYLL